MGVVGSLYAESSAEQRHWGTHLQAHSSCHEDYTGEAPPPLMCGEPHFLVQLMTFEHLRTERSTSSHLDMYTHTLASEDLSYAVEILDISVNGRDDFSSLPRQRHMVVIERRG